VVIQRPEMTDKCVQIDGELWDETECDRELTFVCKKRTVEYDYHFSEEMLSWLDAKRNC